jgi:hypothetical protein
MATVPSFENSLYLRDVPSIINYTLRKYRRTPAKTIPYLSDMIISLPRRVADLGLEPDRLASAIQSDLQIVYNRIFNGTPQVTVSALYQADSNTAGTITISVIYITPGGTADQTGVSIGLLNGELFIPEDKLALPSPLMG